MPIPTRSRSVRTPNTQAEPQLPHHDRGQRDPSTGQKAGVSRIGSSTVSASRIPGLEKRPAASLTSSHARSQSSSTLGIPRPAVSNATSRYGPTSSIAAAATPTAAHARSQSAATSKPVPPTRIQRLQPPSQSLARAPSQSLKPPTKYNPSSSTSQQQLGPLQNTQAAKTGLESTRLARSLSQSQSQPTTTAKALSSSRLEDELLQLAAVYQDSHVSLQRFELSVKHKLEASESTLRAEEDIVRASEEQRQADINAEALWKWLHNSEHALDERRVEDLSFCVSELSDLNAGRGLFNTCMRDFDAWLGQAQDILHQQASRAPPSAQFVEPIDPLWMHNAHELEARLEVCEHLLHQFHDPQCEDDSDSALVFALRRFRRLTKAMEESLAESQSISAAVLATQQAWVTDTLATIVSTSDDGGDVIPRRGLWS